MARSAGTIHGLMTLPEGAIYAHPPRVSREQPKSMEAVLKLFSEAVISFPVLTAAFQAPSWKVDPMLPGQMGSQTLHVAAFDESKRGFLCIIWFVNPLSRIYTL